MSGEACFMWGTLFGSVVGSITTLILEGWKQRRRQR